MELTLRLELKSTDTDFFLKEMGYQMHGICARLNLRFSLSLPVLVVVPRFLPSLVFLIVFFLAIVTEVEVVKTNINFLASVFFFEDIYHLFI